jgi:hypothetical protein
MFSIKNILNYQNKIIRNNSIYVEQFHQNTVNKLVV